MKKNNRVNIKKNIEFNYTWNFYYISLHNLYYIKVHLIPNMIYVKRTTIELIKRKILD